MNKKNIRFELTKMCVEIRLQRRQPVRRRELPAVGLAEGVRVAPRSPVALVVDEDVAAVGLEGEGGRARGGWENGGGLTKGVKKRLRERGRNGSRKGGRNRFRKRGRNSLGREEIEEVRREKKGRLDDRK